ncbi:MAG: BCD family MFS transporter [Anaerolineae bacterium]|jgi:BCD family chlorophyll transporter-like MFS transporter
MKLHKTLRIALYQFWLGGVSVLMLGTLNRVLRIEMGLDLALVGLLLGGAHYLAALVSIPIGYRSDTHPYLGYHRLPYIVAGTLLAVASVVSAPFVAIFVAQDPTPLRLGLAFLFFFVEGLGVNVGATTYLALVTDRTTEQERGRVVSIIWTTMMFGILAAALGGAAYLEAYSFRRLVSLFALAAGLVVLLSVVALWGLERRRSTPAAGGTPPLRAALHVLRRSRQTRIFFTFILLGLFFHFLQDVILEPFGGEVLGLSVRQTTLFNAYSMIGVITGLLLGGSVAIPRLGKKRVAAAGNVIAVLAFALLVFVALRRDPGPVALAIGLMGLGTGAFTVGGVSLMMDLTVAGQAGLFVGAWTLAQALAKFGSSVLSGAIHDLVLATGAGSHVAYAAIFGIEAVGMLLVTALLVRVNVLTFRREVADLHRLMEYSLS